MLHDALVPRPAQDLKLMIGERGTNLGATKIHSHVRRTPRARTQTRARMRAPHVCFVWAQVCVVAQGKENEALGELRRKQQVERKAAKQTAKPTRQCATARTNKQTNKRTPALRCSGPAGGFVRRAAMLCGTQRPCAPHACAAAAGEPAVPRRRLE